MATNAETGVNHLMPTLIPNSPAIPLHDQVLLLDLRLGTLPNSKKVPSSSVEVKHDDDEPDTDNNMLRVSMKILDCPELDEIKRVHHEIRDRVERLELPTNNQFRGGMYLMSYKHVEKMEAHLANAEEQLETCVDHLLDVYDQRIEEARAKLGTLFNEDHYLDPADVRAKLKMQYQIVTLATPEGLRKYKGDVFKREQEKLQKRMEEAVEDSRQIIAAQTRDLLTAVADRLTPSQDGKTKVIRGDMLEGWNETLDLLASKNVTDDTNLAEAIAAAKARLSGPAMADLRGDVALRADIAASFKSVVDRLDEQVIDKPLRRIRLED
jgi:hypothetical protein